MKPTDPPRCEKCDIPKPFLAHWCCYAGRGCPCTEQRVPTPEILKRLGADNALT